MLKLETVENFWGMGDGDKQAEYIFSQGFKRSNYGAMPYWGIVASETDSSTQVNLTRLRWITGTATSLYAVDEQGMFYSKIAGSWSSIRLSAQTNKGNGLIIGQDNSIYYLQSRYVGVYDGTTWNDTWQDFLSDAPDEYSIVNGADRPADLFERYIVMAGSANSNQVNAIALYDTVAGTFNANFINLPGTANIKAIKSGSNGTLVGFNINNAGALMLTDCVTATTPPWIWTEGKINAIAKYEGRWIVSAGNEIFLTNGYTKQFLTMLPDLDIDEVASTPTFPSSFLVKNNYIFLAGGINSYGRKRQGIWIFDMRTRLWEFCATKESITYGVNFGAIFQDSNFNFYVSYGTTIPAKYFIGTLQSAIPTYAMMISKAIGSGIADKVAKKIFLKLNFDFINITNNTNDWTINVGIYDFRRKLFNRGITRAASTVTNELLVDGSLSGVNNARVGDMVWIFEGAMAGQIAFITAINNEGASESWTLDRDLSGLVENEVDFGLMPIRKVGTQWSISDANNEIGEKFFPIEDGIYGKKFAVFLHLNGTQQVIELDSLALEYDELPMK